MSIQQATVHGTPTPQGKRMMAAGHYRRGKSFVGASLLVRQSAGDAS